MGVNLLRGKQHGDTTLFVDHAVPDGTSREMFQNDCLTCHAAIRTTRHQVNYLKAEAIEAAVEDLPPTKKAAIHKRYGICAVYRFPRDDYELQLLAAHEELLRTLPKRNVVI